MNRTQRIVNKLLDDISGFFPYFFGFYVFSLLLSLGIAPLKAFIDWRLFMLSVIILGIASLFSKSEPSKSILAKSTFAIAGLSVDRIMFLFKSIKNVNLSKIVDSWTAVTQFFRRISDGIISILIIFAGILARSWVNLGRRGQIKVVIISVILIFALFRSIGIIDFIVLTYALSSILFVFESRIAAVMSMILLISCPVLLMFKNDHVAEFFAIYAYYFLVITVITQIVEYLKEKRELRSP